MSRHVSSIAALRWNTGAVSVWAGRPLLRVHRPPWLWGSKPSRGTSFFASLNRGHHVDYFSSHFGVHVVVRHGHKHGTANGERNVLFRDHRVVAFDRTNPSYSRTSSFFHFVHRHASARIERDGPHSSHVRRGGPRAQTRMPHVEPHRASHRVPGKGWGRVLRYWRFRDPSPFGVSIYRRSGGGVLSSSSSAAVAAAARLESPREDSVDADLLPPPSCATMPPFAARPPTMTIASVSPSSS
jgi:hypothetical protein